MPFKFNPFTSNFDLVDKGGSFWLDPVADKAALDLILTDTDGSIRVTKDTNDAYRWNAIALAWQFVAKVKVGAFGSTPNSSGFSVSSDNTVTLQPADATNPGGISTTSQNIAGNKTFSGVVVADGGVDVTSVGASDTLSLGTTNADIINIGRSGATVNVQGDTFYQQVTNVQVADKNITLNKGGSAGSASASGVELEENGSITGYAQTSANRNSWELKAPNTAGIATISPGASGITLDQSSHDPVTFATVGSTPNSSGASISSQQITLQPADGSNAGLVSTVAQTFSGDKTFSDKIIQPSTAITSPGLQSSAQSNTGIRFGAGMGSDTVVAIVSKGMDLLVVDRGTGSALNNGYVYTPSRLVTTDGSPTSPAVGFVNNFTTGIYRPATSTIGFTTNGSEIARLDPSGLLISKTVHSDTNNKLEVNSSIKIGTTASSASTATAGTIRWNGSYLQVSDGTNWISLTSSSNDIAETSFSAANNQSSAANVTGLAFANANVRSFEALVSVYVDATSDLFESFKLQGIQRGSDWIMNATSVGDDSGFIFSITTGGQVQYTNNNYSGFSSAVIKFRAITTSV